MSLEELLQDLRSQGNLESEGHFTLNPLKAVEKLKKSLFKDPNQAILKAVQAGVALGIPQIAIGTSREELSIHYGTALRLHEPLAEPYRLLLPHAENPRGVNHLAAALIGFLALDGQLQLDFCDPAGGWRLRTTGTDLRCEPSQSREWTLRVHLRSDRLERSLAQLEHCLLCNTPISLNGRSLEGQLVPRCSLLAAGVSNHGRGSGRLAARCLPTAPLLAHLGPRGGQRIEEVSWHQHEPFDLLVAFAASPSPGKLHLVMDGVETLSYEDVLGAGQLAWMDASGLATDLGGFQLQEGSSLKPLTSEAGAALWELRKLMVKHFDSLPQKWKVAELYLTSEYAARESPWLRR